MINLDTHILLDAVSGRARRDELRVLEGNAWSISDIVIWEIARLQRDGRTKIGLRDPNLSRALREIAIYPVTPQVAEATFLLDFKADPADEIIAATSIAHEIPLLTRDMSILRSKVVPLALT